MLDKVDQYLVLARKYRPKKLSDLVGQDEIKLIVEGAIRQNRLAHAYLFSGTRGVGKTTIARIISKIVNCLEISKKKDIDPCDSCENCTSIDKENNIDVIELDAASKTGVDDVREIIENLSYKPVSALKKIYIIDEVHMLSKSAFNALLKTLEEPPKDILFLLATTETQKIPLTILSRCQHFQLKRIEHEDMLNHILKICKNENIEIDKKSCEIVARCSEGSVRDALSILDNVISRGVKITVDVVKKVLGLSNSDDVLELFKHICEGDVIKALEKTNSLHVNGVYYDQLAKELNNIIYYISRLKIEYDSSNLGLNEYEIKSLLKFSEKMEMDIIIRLWELMQKYFEELYNSYDQRKSFEMIVIRLCYVSLIPTPFEVINEKKEINAKDYSSSLKKNQINDKSNESNILQTESKTFDQNLVTEQKIENNLAIQTKIENKNIKSNILTQRSEINSNIPTSNIINEGLITKFESIIEILELKKQFYICHQLINNYRVVSLYFPKKINENGVLELQNIDNTKINNDILWKISKFLEDFTKSRWIVTIVNKGGIDSLQEIYDRRKKKEIEKFSKIKEIKKLLEIIPGSEIVSIKNLKDKN